MAMNDEERLRAAVGRALKFQPYHSGELVAQYIDSMRAEGITLTPPPAPEPVYTIRLTESERIDLICDVEKAQEHWTVPDNIASSERMAARLHALTPDPEPGT